MGETERRVSKDRCSAVQCRIRQGHSCPLSSGAQLSVEVSRDQTPRPKGSTCCKNGRQPLDPSSSGWAAATMNTHYCPDDQVPDPGSGYECNRRTIGEKWDTSQTKPDWVGRLYFLLFFSGSPLSSGMCCPFSPGCARSQRNRQRLLWYDGVQGTEGGIRCTLVRGRTRIIIIIINNIMSRSWRRTLPSTTYMLLDIISCLKHCPFLPSPSAIKSIPLS
jgi:hypothetical protein